MKITHVHAFPVWVGTRNQCLVKIETDEGIYGWGESGLSSRELAVVGAVKHYAEFLVGRDPFRIGALWQEMYRSQYFEGGRVLTAAISAIDIALHDIVAKALNVPVYQLLGGKQRDEIPCFATINAPMGPKLLEDAHLLLDHGWKAIRTVPGIGHSEPGSNVFEPRESIAVTATWLTKLREELGPGPILGIDYHHRLTIAETASFCQRMPSGTLDFLEEPIRDESPEAYEALRRMVDVPFAIGEEISSKWHFLPYIERNITDFVRLDICNLGGFTESMKVAGWAEAHYIDLMPHNPLGPICTAASVHLGAAVPNFAWLEIRVSPTENSNRYDESIFQSAFKVGEPTIVVPDVPGLGVEVNEEYVRSQSFKFWEAPRLRRRDGSYQNW
jgi:galactonate dehydratase